MTSRVKHESFRSVVRLSEISVVVPVYNAADFLTESIASLSRQSFDDIEIICVNDGSTDNSLTLLNNMAKKDRRIKVIDKENGGCGSARNQGLYNAKSKYVYFFDPDDYILPNALEELYYNAEANNSDIVLSQIAWYTEGQRINYDKPGYNLNHNFPNVDFNNFTFNYKQAKEYVLNSYYAPWTKLYRKDFLDSNKQLVFDENIAFDDVPFHVKTMLKADRISFIQKAFYHYRTSNKHSVNNTVSNALDIMRICDIVELFLRDNDYMDEFKVEFNHFKITQFLLYIIFSNSECYFKYVQNEFMKMDVDYKIGEKLYEKYQLVINSASYDEYRQKRNVKPVTDNTKEYLNRINELEHQTNNLSDKVKKTNIEKIRLNNRNHELRDENSSLKNENETLTNDYEKLKREYERIKSINDDILSSKTWKLNRFAHKMNPVEKIRK